MSSPENNIKPVPKRIPLPERKPFASEEGLQTIYSSVEEGVREGERLLRADLEELRRRTSRNDNAHLIIINV